MGDVAERQDTVTAADGVALQTWLSVPPEPVGLLLLCHGLTTGHHENGSFDKLRVRAMREGLAVLRFDFRAHGESGSDNEHLRLAGMRADVDAVLGRADRELPDLPVVPVGLSFGGAAAVHAAATHPRAAGLVLWYAVVDYEHNYGTASPVAFSHQMRADVGEATPEWAGMTIAVLGYHFPTELIAEFPSDRTVETLAGLDVPVLSFHGTRDRFVDPEPIERLGREHGHVTARRVPGAGHGYLLWMPWVARRTSRFAAGACRAAG